MTIYKHLPRSRKKVKDEFISGVDHSIRFILGHKKIFLIGLVLAVLSSILLLYGHQKREADLVGANDEIYKGSLSDLPRPVSWIASFLLFGSSLQGHDDEQALSVLDRASGFPSPLKPLVLWNKAQVLWQQGKQKEALSLLRSSEQDFYFFAEELVFLKGELLESMGRTEEATQIYQELAGNEDVDPLLAKRISTRLGLLKR